METAKENGLHPYHYLEYLLSKLPGSTTSDLECFLPWSDALPDICHASWKEVVADEKKGLEFMMEYVQDYLDGETERMFFDLDFVYYLTENYPAMERKDSEMAEGFVFYLMEEGLDRAGDLTDAQHKKLIRRQFKAFTDALAEGIW